MKENFADTPRRNKYELWIDILDICANSPMHLSQIMRNLRLRTGKCKEYISFLIQKELLSISRDETNNSIIYNTTSKGREAVEKFLQVLTHFFS